MGSAPQKRCRVWLKTPLGEGKDFRWAHGEHEHAAGFVAKTILIDVVLPSPVPLLRPGCGEPLELL